MKNYRKIMKRYNIQINKRYLANFCNKQQNKLKLKYATIIPIIRGMI